MTTVQRYACLDHMNEEKLKLCIHCRHYVEQSWGYGVSRTCFASLTRVDPVDGDRHFLEPRDARKVGATCGPEGRLFEEKPPHVPGRSIFRVIWDWIRQTA